jgi:hypothetical protein
LLILIPLYVVAGITGILELQVFLMYAALVAGAYLLVGAAVLRACWFPILYLAFRASSAGSGGGGHHPAGEDRYFRPRR